MTRRYRKTLSLACLATVVALMHPALVSAKTYYSLEMDQARLTPQGMREDGRHYKITREGGGKAAQISQDPIAGSKVLVLGTSATPQASTKDRAEMRIYSGITFDRTWFLGLRAMTQGTVAKDAWHLMMQCHQTGSAKSPPLSLNLEAGNKISLIARSSQDAYERLWTGDMPQGQWADIVVGFRMGAKGHVRLWMDGRLVVERRLPLRWDGYQDRCVLKTGLYRSASDRPFQMRFDDIRLGDRYLDVAR